MNLPRTVEFTASRNWDKVRLPNRDWEGSNDHNDKASDIAWKSKTIIFLDLPHNQINFTKVKSLMKIAMDNFLLQIWMTCSAKQSNMSTRNTS